MVRRETHVRFHDRQHQDWNQVFPEPCPGVNLQVRGWGQEQSPSYMRPRSHVILFLISDHQGRQRGELEAHPHTWGWLRKGFKCSAKSVHSSKATCPRRDLMQPPMAIFRALCP